MVVCSKKNKNKERIIMVGLSGQTFNHLKPKGNIIKSKKKEI